MWHVSIDTINRGGDAEPPSFLVELRAPWETMSAEGFAAALYCAMGERQRT